MANYCTNKEMHAKAAKHHEEARRQRSRAEEYRAAAQRIKKQWTR